MWLVLSCQKFDSLLLKLLAGNFAGTFAVLWWLLWFVLVKESPQEDRFIKRTELDYILGCLGSTADQLVCEIYLFFVVYVSDGHHNFVPQIVPWKAILTSLPVWATVSAHFAENWGFYTLLTQLPTFLSGNTQISAINAGVCFLLTIAITDTSHLKLDKTGFLAAIPYLAMSVVVQCGGQLADWLRAKWRVETTTVLLAFLSFR